MTTPDVVHPNVDVLNRVNFQNLESCANLFTDDFIWHYRNPKRPDIDGDYHGVAELGCFFAKLNEISKGRFQINPIDVRPVGDELVFVHACNRLTLDDMEKKTVEFDAIVIWRIIDGRIHEAWDIPAVHSVRTVRLS